ncbi:RNA polymerase sigma-70 factor (ECF subfamily) [Asanoa ferruginea]|uniref:RNA polymerase sigma-70 factor (ECF subfamily) n=1 Tax=Asanoa ferruginea TaxID=53367 RepID=A0A3D9ZX06_9ACTN|nr:sigma-70 family RNA polymerase sigma factor [Asanoa ferruginea]REG01757.1 RNA polymerase sigma-70 factor (ECF subfamily) [Asanoa ferruginea]GIF49210.1 RNA polymerase sigma24 factor [Asanoa ferruginea]
MHDFDDFYAAHYAEIVVQVFAAYGDRQDAEDVAQEAFVRALARWQRLDSYDDPAAWVRRVAFNLAASRWRRLRTAHAFLQSQRDEPVIEPPGAERLAIVEALATLPHRVRRAMALRYLVDLPIAEIAAREGVPEATVRSWLHRGRIALAARLKAEVNHA